MQEILHAISQGPHPVSVQGLTPSSEAYLLAKLKTAHPDQTIVRITPDGKSALQLKEDLEFFMEDRGRAPGQVHLFPAHDGLPYTGILPQPDVTAERMSLLHRLAQKEPLLLVVPLAAWLRFLPPVTIFRNCTQTLRLFEALNRDATICWLEETGYTHTPLVEEPGTFAARGNILDIFSPALESPIRIELEGDLIAAMRFFDPASQRSLKGVESLLLIPARETLYNDETKTTALKQLKIFSDRQELPATLRRQVQEYLEQEIYFTGVETFLPIFFPKLATLADTLPPSAWIIAPESTDLEAEAARQWKELTELYAEVKGPEKIIPPELLWQRTVAVQPTVIINPLRDDKHFIIDAQLPIFLRTQEDPFKPIAEQIRTWRNAKYDVTLLSHTEIQLERILDLLKYHGLANIKVQLGKLSGGFVWPSEKKIFLTEQELFGHKTMRRIRKAKAQMPVTSFSDLNAGDHLVHEEQGICRYLGLQHMTIGGLVGDYLVLEFLGGDKLYLPIVRLGTVQKYIGGNDGSPILDRMGGTRWLRAKKKAGETIFKIAQELLRVHAQRALFPGFAYPPEDLADEEFAAGFAYDETPDQAKAIDDVLKDLGRDKPMDRLICGDVGYGKTEVAMRAAFKVVASGRQACVLVPTTVLALQHFESFQTRFAKNPIRVEMLSRFRSAKEQKEIVAELKGGKIDIVIGTHRLLANDIVFKKLGLLIIDEEHRFGVRHKEKIKKLRSHVDVLTLSATPIPRTLHMSLIGLKDLSLIHTPPADRLSIRSYIAKFDDAILRHAILKELERDGQIFFVHNRVATIESMREKLAKLVPESPVAVAHGQMGEEELEKVMIDFLHRKTHILLCTAIIESGLDCPNANTIIINRADTFGLAQLYQLRGRVGRSDRQAFCYLLIPDEELITKDAKRRLAVLTRHTDLGSGFQIASQDLEIRGAGNLLGGAQSGFIEEIGYDLYTRLLTRTIRKLKGEKVLEELEPEISWRVAAFLPDVYIADAQLRMDLYKRLSHVSSVEELEQFRQELIDRFGELPQETLNLLSIVSVKIPAQALRISALRYEAGKLLIDFDSSTPLSPQTLIDWTLAKPKQFQLKPPGKLIVHLPTDLSPEQALEEAKKLLSEWGNYATP